MTRETANSFVASNVSENEIYKFLATHWQHQNQLSWSRLYALLALESGTLAGSYSVKGWTGLGLLLVGTLVGFILYRLIKRDWDVRDQDKLREILDRVHEPLGIRMISPREPTWCSGQFLLNALFVVLLLTNIVSLAILRP